MSKEIEQKLKSLLDFNRNLSELVVTAIVYRGLDLSAPSTKELVGKVDIDAMWDKLYTRLLAAKTPEQIEAYVAAIEAIKETLSTVMGEIGGEVNDLLFGEDIANDPPSPNDTSALGAPLGEPKQDA